MTLQSNIFPQFSIGSLVCICSGGEEEGITSLRICSLLMQSELDSVVFMTASSYRAPNQPRETWQEKNFMSIGNSYKTPTVGSLVYHCLSGYFCLTISHQTSEISIWPIKWKYYICSQVLTGPESISKFHYQVAQMPIALTPTTSCPLSLLRIFLMGSFL